MIFHLPTLQRDTVQPIPNTQYLTRNVQLVTRNRADPECRIKDQTLNGVIYLFMDVPKSTAISAESKEQRTKAEKEPKVELAMGEGTILVIEDEEPLVEIFRQILERLGYRVLLARTGKEAVELAKTFDGQIDLALLDIKLPDMDGGRVYPLIMESRPDMKTIVCSGYSIHGPAQAILDAGAEGFIQKPFSIAPFAEKLKEVLEGK